MSTNLVIHSDIETDSQNPLNPCNVSSVGIEELKNLLDRLEILSGTTPSLTFEQKQFKIWDLCIRLALCDYNFSDNMKILFLNLAREILPIINRHNGLKVITAWRLVKNGIYNDYYNLQYDIFDVFNDLSSEISSIMYILNETTQMTTLMPMEPTQIDRNCILLAVYNITINTPRIHFLNLAKSVLKNRTLSEIKKNWENVQTFVTSWASFKYNINAYQYHAKLTILTCSRLQFEMNTFLSINSEKNQPHQIPAKNHETQHEQSVRVFKYKPWLPYHHSVQSNNHYNQNHTRPISHNNIPTHHQTENHTQHPRHHSGHPMFSRYIPWHANPNRLPPAVYRRPDGSHFILSNKITPQETTSDPTDSTTTQSDQSENSATVETV